MTTAPAENNAMSTPVAGAPAAVADGSAAATTCAVEPMSAARRARASRRTSAGEGVGSDWDAEVE